MRLAIITIFLVVFLGVGVILLQIFLSKKESKWAGLVLPIISFGISMLFVFGIVIYNGHTETTIHSINGEIVERTIDVTQIENVSSIIWASVFSFLLFNIPTVVQLTIYVACRGKRNRQRALDRMSIQDLG